MKCASPKNREGRKIYVLRPHTLALRFGYRVILNRCPSATRSGSGVPRALFVY